MPMSVVYATVNGRLVQENRGGAMTRFVADTLGSIIQTRDAAGNQTSSTTYWPFGEVWTSSGTNPSPWGFCGTLGYFKDALARRCVRARVLRTDLSRWFTVDPGWPDEIRYGYAHCNPGGFIDPSGLQTIGPYIPSVWDPIPNIDYAIRAMCRKGAGDKGGFHCDFHRWGTKTGPRTKYDCCKSCLR